MNAQDPGVRDALAVMAAQLHGDEAGVWVLLDSAADLRAVAVVLAEFAVEAARMAGGRDVSDGDLAGLLRAHLCRMADGTAR